MRKIGVHRYMGIGGKIRGSLIEDGIDNVVSVVFWPSRVTSVT